MPSRLVIPANLPRQRIQTQDERDYTNADLSESSSDDLSGQGSRAPPASPTSRAESTSSTEQAAPTEAVPKHTGSFTGFWSVFSSYVRRAVSAACRPGSGIELSRRGASARPAHVCIAEVAMDVDIILTVRSWWPSDLSLEEVRQHGLDQARTSARQWWRENSHELIAQRAESQEPHFKVPTDFDTVDRDLLPLVSYSVSGQPDASSEECDWVTPRSRASDLECSICLDSESDCRLRTCHHGFHRECLATWFCKSRKLCCPLCRSSLDVLIPEHVRNKVMDTVEEEAVEPEVINVRIEEGVIDSGDSDASSPVNGFL